MGTATILLTPVALGIGMLLLMELGRRWGRHAAASYWDDFSKTREACRPVDAAVFALFGLLLAFTFGRAAMRFNERLDMIIEEVNAIGTAWQDIDLLPAAGQPPVRANMRRYLDARLAVYAALPDVEAARVAVDTVDQEAGRLWRSAIAAYGDKEPHVSFVEAFSSMFGVGTKRTLAMEMHVPSMIVALLFVIALGSALLIGLEMARAPRRSPLTMVSFVGAVAITVWVILDIEYPRFGLLRIDQHDHSLHELRAKMG